MLFTLRLLALSALSATSSSAVGAQQEEKKRLINDNSSSPFPPLSLTPSLSQAGEGFKHYAYPDTTGHRTICVGYNMDAQPRSEIEAFGVNYNAVYAGRTPLSTSQCLALLKPKVGGGGRRGREANVRIVGIPHHFIAPAPTTGRPEGKAAATAVAGRAGEWGQVF